MDTPTPMKKAAANAYNRASHIVIRRVHFMHRSSGNHCAEHTLRASLIDEIQRQGKEVAANACSRALHIGIRRVHFMHCSSGNRCAEHTLQASLIDTPTPMKKSSC
jgi:hypothetical protein